MRKRGWRIRAAWILAASMLAAGLPAEASQEPSQTGQTVSGGEEGPEEERSRQNEENAAAPDAADTEKAEPAAAETGSGNDSAGSENSEPAQSGQEAPADAPVQKEAEPEAVSGEAQPAAAEEAGSGADAGAGSEEAGTAGGEENASGAAEEAQPAAAAEAGSGENEAPVSAEAGSAGGEENASGAAEEAQPAAAAEAGSGENEAPVSAEAGPAEPVQAENAGEAAPAQAAEGTAEAAPAQAENAAEGESDAEEAADPVIEERTVPEEEAQPVKAEQEPLVRTEEAAGGGEETAAGTAADNAENELRSSSRGNDGEKAENAAAEVEEVKPAAEDSETAPVEETQTAPAEEDTVPRDSSADTPAAVDGTAQLTSAKASVTWKDDNDANDIRPGFLTVYLQTSSDGENYDDGKAYELNAKNKWQILLENLPAVKNGKKQYYRWVWDVDLVPGVPEEDQDEYNIVGYTRTQKQDSEDHLQSSREYTHVTVKEKYTIAIEWDDNGDDTAKRPKSLDVTLPDGRVVTLTAENGWKTDVEMPVVHRDLVWTIGAAEGWVSGGNSTDYSGENTLITFTRKWKTTKKRETTVTEEEVEEPAGYSTLTVQYWIGDESAAPSFTGIYENGQKYNVRVPDITGYRAKVTKVKGKIDEDTVINVRYVPNNYTVTVYYRYLNGETAAGTVQQQYPTGTAFSLASPFLDGYAVSTDSVSGVITGRDLTYVVYYTGIVPENYNGAGRQEEQMIYVAGAGQPAGQEQEEPELTEISEYKTPLGLGEVGINAGECFE